MSETRRSEVRQDGQAELRRLLGEAKVPTLPMVAQKLVDLCKDENANFSDFARVLETDPGLASRLLRVANSAYYGLRNKASTLEQAITALGLKYVKSISLGFHLATSLNEFEAEGFGMDRFWEHSVLRGVIARQLASVCCPKRREEAFLIGLLQDCGIPVLVAALGSEYAHLWGKVKGSQAALKQMEKEMFGFDHQMAAEVVTRQWSLPDVLAEPIRHHHTRPRIQQAPRDEDRLYQIAYFVGALSLNNPESLSEEDYTLVEYAERVFELDGDGIAGLLEDSQQEFRSIAQLFAGVLSESVDVAHLLVQANSLLGRLAEDGPHEVFDLEDQVNLLRSRCEELAQCVNQYQQQATTDALTGLATREPMIEYIASALDAVRNAEASLAVLFMDVDCFKTINDTMGHAAGDYFLKELAKLLKDVLKESGCVARFGGDEMVVALSGLGRDQAEELANGLARKVQTIQQVVICDGKECAAQLSCSMGLVFLESGVQGGGVDKVLELADEQMYEAKRGGKGKVCSRTIEVGVGIA